MMRTDKTTEPKIFQDHSSTLKDTSCNNAAARFTSLSH